MASKWDRKMMGLALHIGGWSKDRSRGVGCVITGPNNEIRTTGYNGLPRGVRDDVESRQYRPQKYLWTEHAERNAIYNAARAGIALGGCHLYVPWYPCVDCARAIIQCGLQEVTAVEPNWGDEQWATHFEVTQEMLSEAGVEVRFIDLSSILDQDQQY